MNTQGSKAEPNAGSNHEPTRKGKSFELGAQVRTLRRVGRRIARKGWTLGIRAWRKPDSGETGGINPENIVWIFGAGRTGSTWLSQMMGELERSAVWFEPWVGMLFDPYHLRLDKRKGQHFILAPQYRSTWLGSMRSFVMDGAKARFPELDEDAYLIVKEPGGAVGASLLMEALPESRMVFLIRDPRDVVASWLDALNEGGWRSGRMEEGELPSEIVDKRATNYARSVGEAKKAYELHGGRKVLVRYEDLRTDTLREMRRIYSALEIPVDEGQLLRAVEEHSWENIPEEEKGEGKFYRKATPGSWREDLTPEQVEKVESITAHLLKELYPS